MAIFGRFFSSKAAILNYDNFHGRGISLYKGKITKKVDENRLILEKGRINQIPIINVNIADPVRIGTAIQWG